MKAWSNLPNAKYIDKVFADLKSHPEEFARAWDAAGLADWDAALAAAWRAALDAVRDAAWRAA